MSAEPGNIPPHPAATSAPTTKSGTSERPSTRRKRRAVEEPLVYDGIDNSSTKSINYDPREDPLSEGEYDDIAVDLLIDRNRLEIIDNKSYATSGTCVETRKFSGPFDYSCNKSGIMCYKIETSAIKLHPGIRYHSTVCYSKDCMGWSKDGVKAGELSDFKNKPTKENKDDEGMAMCNPSRRFSKFMEKPSSIYSKEYHWLKSEKPPDETRKVFVCAHGFKSWIEKGFKKPYGSHWRELKLSDTGKGVLSDIVVPPSTTSSIDLSSEETSTGKIENTQRSSTAGKAITVAEAYDQAGAGNSGSASIRTAPPQDTAVKFSSVQARLPSAPPENHDSNGFILADPASWSKYGSTKILSTEDGGIEHSELELREIDDISSGYVDVMRPGSTKSSTEANVNEQSFRDTLDSYISIEDMIAAEYVTEFDEFDC